MMLRIIVLIFLLVCMGCSNTARFNASGAEMTKQSPSEQKGEASRTGTRRVASQELLSRSPAQVQSSLHSFPVPKVQQPSFRQTGTASYYARKFHGRRTASGERYDMRELTAAHKKIPFGTRLKVTNLSNGKTVIVRVNDRGPHSKKRIIDLSYAAARKIGLCAIGTAHVSIETVE